MGVYTPKARSATPICDVGYFAKRAAEGHRDSLERLAEALRPVCNRMARRYRVPSHEHDDLMQEALLACLRYVERCQKLGIPRALRVGTVAWECRFAAVARRRLHDLMVYWTNTVRGQEANHVSIEAMLETQRIYRDTGAPGGDVLASDTDTEREALDHIEAERLLREARALAEPIEWECIRLVADGWEQADIAIIKGISRHAVSKHIRALREKAGLGRYGSEACERYKGRCEQGRRDAEAEGDAATAAGAAGPAAAAQRCGAL